MTDGVEPDVATDVALTAYARALATAARALAEYPQGRLRGTLGRARDVLAAAGSRLGRDAAWLRSREDYLADASARLAGEVTRLEVALAAPAESDLSVRVTAVREAIRYFGDVSADLVPAQVYLDVGRDLLPAIEHDFDAPGVALRLVPLVQAVLSAMRSACDLGAALTERADAVLRELPPDGDRVMLPHQSLYGVHRAEIDRLIAAVGRARPALAARPSEADDVRLRALQEGLNLTPGQLEQVLAGLPGGGGGSASS